MHLAHQQLFSKLDQNGAIVVIQTCYANLTPITNREEYSKYPIFYYPLESIKHLNGEQFINLLNEEFPKLENIVVGFDFHFGHKALYNIDNLRDIFKGSVNVIDEYKKDDIAIHSRIIREYLRIGNLDLANNLLGHNYKIKGFHIQGQGLGSKQFVPTINIEVDNFLIPKEGIYITKTKVDNQLFSSVTFLGHRVTTDGKFAIETHILDQDELTIKSKNIEIIFYKRLRDNKKFENYEDLRNQINEDIKKAKTYKF